MRIRFGTIWIAMLAGLLTSGAARAEGYKVERLVPSSPFHGVHGMEFDKDGNLFAGSVIGQSLYKVDTKSGDVTTVIGPPQGMADDIAFAPDGTMAWTALIMGDLYSKKGDGPIIKLASGLPGVNALAFRKNGRLYATQVFLGDALYEIDTNGQQPPRMILEKLGGLNGFQFGPDDMLYGPIFFKGQVVKIDVDKATVTVLADGFKEPSAVNLDSQGNIYVVDTKAGQLVKVDPKTGAKIVAAQLEPGLDNLAIDSHDRIIVSNFADPGIQEIDPKSGKVRQIVKGRLSLPGGIVVSTEDGKDTLYVADTFAYRSVDATTGSINIIHRMHAGVIEYPMNATGNDKHIVLSGWISGAVQVMDRKTGNSLAKLNGFKAPQDALELPDGSILVAEIGTGSLIKATGEQGETRTVVAKDLQAPSGLAWADKEAVYLTEIAGPVSRVDLNSGAKTVIATLKQPEGIAVAPDGMIVVAEVGAKRVVGIDPNSGKVTELAGNLPIGLPAAPGMPPSAVFTGVAVSKSGTIYLTSDIENSVYKLTGLVKEERKMQK